MVPDPGSPQLHAGDTLHTPDGTTVKVQAIQATGTTTTVHNLHVPATNNYHVHTTTNQPILVHNNTGPKKKGLDPCEAYDAGTYDELVRRSQVGDGLDIHHIPQKHPAGQVVEGYDPKTGVAIALPKEERKKYQDEKECIMAAQKNLSKKT